MSYQSAIHVKGPGLKGMDWIHVAQYRDQGRELVRAIPLKMVGIP